MTVRIPPVLQKQIDALEPAIRDGFLRSVYDLRSEAKIAQVTDAIRRYDTTALYEALNLEPTFFAPLDRAIQAAYIEGGSQALIGLPPVKDPNTGIRVVSRFDARNQTAEEWLRNHSSSLISGIVEDTKQAVRIALEAGAASGRGPRDTALDITGRINKVTGRREGGILGLAWNQAEYVVRARAELLSGDPKLLRNYLTRERRDRKFDGIVRRAIKSGKPVSVADADKMTGRYKDRLLQLRGETIARTETLAGLNAGKQEGIKQLIASGKVPLSAVKKIWRATGDARTRDSHISMNDQVVKFDEPFISPLTGAQMMHPHDLSLGAPPSETIQCRCFYEIKINYIWILR